MKLELDVRDRTYKEYQEFLEVVKKMFGTMNASENEQYEKVRQMLAKDKTIADLVVSFGMRRVTNLLEQSMKTTLLAHMANPNREMTQKDHDNIDKFLEDRR